MNLFDVTPVTLLLVIQELGTKLLRIVEYNVNV